MKRLALLMVVILCLSGMSVEVLASAPAPHGPVPNHRQLAWQKLERIAFIHYGMNTYTNKEWGDGTENPNTFNPTGEYNPEQWVKTLKDNGFELVILTAKHHDGFCLWPSEYTTHDVASSNWKNGEGDVLKDISEACAKYDLKLGLYLSPWDRNAPSYGQGDAYNEYMENQLREVLTNYGPIYEMWFDGAKDSNIPQDYDKESWFELIHELQPDCAIWGDYGEIRWTGNEQGIGGDPCWSRTHNFQKIDELGLNHDQKKALLQNGNAQGDIWWPAEADVSIRPGWFYHSSQDNQVKSLGSLVNIYKKSVGRNNVLLLNIPVDRRGLFHENDIARLKEFNKWVEDSFANNLVAGSTVTVSNKRDDNDIYAGSQVLDGDFDTYWATDDSVTTADLVIDFGSVKTFNTVMLQEYIALGQRVESFAIDVWKNDQWVEVDAKTTIGYKRLVTLANQITSKVRIRITGAQACPLISEVGMYMIGPVDDHQNPQKNFALGKNVTVSNVHSDMFSGDKAVDGSLETRWATSDQTTSCSIEIDFWEPVTFNKVYLNQFLSRIGNYTIEYFNGQDWVLGYSGSNPQSEENINFEALTGNKMRLNILDINGNLGPSIYEIGVFYEEPAPVNLALNKSIQVSGTETDDFPGSMANDGDSNTRWSSRYYDNEWLQLDLGQIYDISKVNLRWEAAYGKKYKILLSTEGTTWQEVINEDNSDGGLDEITFQSTQGRYVKMQGVERATEWGFSLYEIEVYN